MKKMQLILGFTAFAGLIAIAVVAYNFLAEEAEILPPPAEVTEETAPETETARDFTMQDMYGNDVRLSDFFGAPIVLNFWTTWCPSCVAEIPYFTRLHEEFGNEVQILKVNLLDGQRETRAGVDAFLLAHGLEFPVFFDTSGEAARAYGVRFIPLTFFIGANGVIVDTVQGALNEESLTRGLDAMFGV